jgi:hypothetical protein
LIRFSLADYGGKQKMNSFRGFLFYAALPAMAFWSTGVLAFTDFGHGKPITVKDLSGKKFCWNNGDWAFYGPNGQMSNRLGRHPHWSVGEPGVLHVNSRRVQVELLPDGRLHAYRYCLLCGDHDLDSWATPCN